MNIKYLLLGDPDWKHLSIQETALKYFYGGDIVLATTSSEVLSQLKSRGKPELLFVDFSFITQNDNELHKYLEEDEFHFPVITCSAKIGTDDISVRFPMVSAILEKPISVDAFTSLVKGIMTAPLISPGYLPLSINTVLDHGIGDFDIFLKLSETNFVKILNKGDGFSKAHAEKLQSKGIHEIHIKASDSQNFLKIWEENLNFVLAKKSLTTL